jgi:hypothetical protein
LRLQHIDKSSGCGDNDLNTTLQVTNLRSF